MSYSPLIHDREHYLRKEDELLKLIDYQDKFKIKIDKVNYNCHKLHNYGITGCQKDCQDNIVPMKNVAADKISGRDSLDSGVSKTIII